MPAKAVVVTFRPPGFAERQVAPVPFHGDRVPQPEPSVPKSADRPIAKLTRPDVLGLSTRGRLVGLLDAGSRRPVTWVEGPAGAGKTSLVSSYLDARGLPCLWYRLDAGDADVATFFYYLGLAARRVAPRGARPLPLLTPEYLQGLGTFTRRFFEALCERVGRPFMLALDDYQEVPEGSGFHEVLRDGLYAVPDGVRVMVMSRGAPPPALARLQASSSVCHVGWQDLRFTPDEVEALVRARDGRRLGQASLTALFQRTEGWAAGIVLLLARLRMGDPDVAALARSTPEEVFHFFAGELFEKADAETQAFLLRSSPLPSMTAATAAELTGHAASRAILARLGRRHFFTEALVSTGGEPAYQYHPLFREFLASRAEATLPPSEHAALKRRAAALLEAAGQAEPAADLLIETGDWGGLARLVQAWSPALLAQGRASTLLRWLRSFPATEVAGSAWLQYWLGACLLSSDPVESRRQFERAFERFDRGRELDGVFLSWSGLMEAVLLGWGDFSDADRWIAVLERLLREGAEPPTPTIWARVTTSMLFALTLRQPHHPDLPSWVERARRFAAGDADPRLAAFLNVYLELYHLWIGDHAGAELVLVRVRETTASRDASPLARILGRIIEAVYLVRMAEHDRCRQAVTDGLELALSSGVVIWNSQLFSQGALNALSEGDLAEAGRWLEQMGASYGRTRRIDACMYHFSSAWLAFLERQLPRAVEHATAALRLALEAGTPFHEGISRIALAHLLDEQGDAAGAAAQLAGARAIADAMRSRILAFMIALCEADAALRADPGAAALGKLARALALGREQGYVNFYWWRPDVMARLCAAALRAGIEVPYAQRLVRARRLVPPSPAAADDRWPWPVRIRTLGGFELWRNGEPLVFTGKVQRKPLALVKALVALGGRDVAEEHLADALWPDADGDLARRSLETCLHRLRKLVGHDDVVRVRERRVRLDERACAVDLWAVEHAFSRVEAAWSAAGDPAAAERALRGGEEAVASYPGHFLPAEETACALACRERLRRRFLRVAIETADRLAQAREWPRAAQVVRRALELEGDADPVISPADGSDRARAEAIYLRGRAALLEHRDAAG